jgi:hypothetical protein
MWYPRWQEFSPVLKTESKDAERRAEPTAASIRKRGASQMQSSITMAMANGTWQATELSLRLYGETGFDIFMWIRSPSGNDTDTKRLPSLQIRKMISVRSREKRRIYKILSICMKRD